MWISLAKAIQEMDFTEVLSGSPVPRKLKNIYIITSAHSSSLSGPLDMFNAKRNTIKWLYGIFWNHGPLPNWINAND